MLRVVCYILTRIRQRGYSLYVRPNMIGTQKTLGVGPPGSALFYTIACPVGPYYPTGFKAVSLEATTYAVRAWPGGVGNSKLGANYAPCIVPQMQAATRGFHQNLWLFEEGGEEYVTEVGTMNLFAAIRNKDGQKELLTAPLDGTILAGVTRDSILALARERLVPEGWKITERRYTMKELDEAAQEGRMLEVFGSGTAAVVSPVRKIGWRGKMLDCGLPDNKEAGPIATRMLDWMMAIQYGDEPHPWRSAISRFVFDLLYANVLQCQGVIGLYSLIVWYRQSEARWFIDTQMRKLGIHKRSFNEAWLIYTCQCLFTHRTSSALFTLLILFAQSVRACISYSLPLSACALAESLRFWSCHYGSVVVQSGCAVAAEVFHSLYPSTRMSRR